MELKIDLCLSDRVEHGHPPLLEAPHNEPRAFQCEQQRLLTTDRKLDFAAGGGGSVRGRGSGSPSALRLLPTDRAGKLGGFWELPAQLGGLTLGGQFLERDHLRRRQDAPGAIDELWCWRLRNSPRPRTRDRLQEGKELLPRGGVERRTKNAGTHGQRFEPGVKNLFHRTHGGVPVGGVSGIA